MGRERALPYGQEPSTPGWLTAARSVGGGVPRAGSCGQIQSCVHVDSTRRSRPGERRRCRLEAVSWQSVGSQEVVVSDSTVNDASDPSVGRTIDEVLRDVEPMGDLGGFVINDLTPEEEDEFFAILEDV